jgi:hypothetical protein
MVRAAIPSRDRKESLVRRSIIGGAAVTVGLLAAAGVAVGQLDGGVPNANQRSGSPVNVLAPGFTNRPRAHGTDQLENPSDVFTRYGYLNDSEQQTDKQDTKTEPDQNVYLVTSRNPGGPTAGYDYGNHFLVQPHELFNPGPGGQSRAYITRINLDVRDRDHRITLLTQPDAAGDTGATSLDGITYDPFNGELLAAGEGGQASGIIGTSLRWSSTTQPEVRHYQGSMGTGGFEGIHNDKLGNLMIIEDAGGNGVVDNAVTPAVTTAVRQPNSFVFRFKPSDRSDLTQGELQVLQISYKGTPITFHDRATDPTGARDDALGEPIHALHSGDKLDAKWITVHDTATDGTATFNANTLAKSKGGTPLKRPENGKFVPDTDFRSFVFTETGDTNGTATGSNYPGAAQRGSWGAILRIDMKKAGADTATVKAEINGDQTHNSFDNITFASDSKVLVGEDRGDSLHQQLNALDSLWQFDLDDSLDRVTTNGKRVMAEGRDPAARQDVHLREDFSPSLTHNDGDNEVTGIHVSNGSTSPFGLLGAIEPGRGPGWRVFWTQQHGANITYEILRPSGRDHGHR